MIRALVYVRAARVAPSSLPGSSLRPSLSYGSSLPSTVAHTREKKRAARFKLGIGHNGQDSNLGLP